jgi:hypothetical protein
MEDKIKSNKYGKLWIETKDFFSSEKVKQMIHKLKNSNLVKTIEKNEK